MSYSHTLLCFHVGMLKNMYGILAKTLNNMYEPGITTTDPGENYVSKKHDHHL